MDHHHHHHDDAKDRPDDVPFDAANQSLADALRASFRILKVIMFLLVIVFLCSGIRIVDTSEEAIVLRLGKTHLNKDGKPFQAGVVLGFPYPVDEVLTVPTKERNTLKIMSHWFHVRKEDEHRSLSDLATRYAGDLDPVRDGALLTADHGIVHVKWTVFYRINDLEKYILNVADTTQGRIEPLITALLESAAIRTVSEYTAEQVWTGRSSEIAERVKDDVNAVLGRLATGVRIESLEPETTVPMNTLPAFSAVTQAWNTKAAEVQKAEKMAGEMLAAAAGEAHIYLTGLMELRDAAERDGHQDLVAELDKAIGRTFSPLGDAAPLVRGSAYSTPADAVRRLTAAVQHWETQVKGGDDVTAAAARTALFRELQTDYGFRVSGDAGSRLAGAKAYYTKAVQKMRGEVEVYQAVLEEYERNPDLLINRLWDETRTKLLTSTGVTKIGLPGGIRGLWFQIGPDPKQKELDEIARIKKELEEKNPLKNLTPTIHDAEDHGGRM